MILEWCVGSGPELQQASLQKRKLHLFEERKDRSASVILIASLCTPLYVSCCLSEARHNQHSNLLKYLQNARTQSDRAVSSDAVKHELQHLPRRL